MPRLIATLIMGICLLFCPPAVADDGAPSPNESPPEHSAPTDGVSNDFGPAHRQRIFEASRLDTKRALLYTAALPGIGNFYADQPAVGTVALMSMVFTTMFIAFGWRNNHPDLRLIGYTTGAATYVGSAVTAYIGVRRYNDQLRRSLHIHDEPSAHHGATPQWTLGWSWSF